MSVARVLQRVVMPVDNDPDVLALYVETGTAAAAPTSQDRPAGGDRDQHPEQVLDRQRLRVAAGQRASFATYFNAFPASYWKRWTTVTDLELGVEIEGPGTVVVYRSTASGSTQRVAVDTTTEGEPRSLTFPLSLTPFGDGGWYWFDLVAGATPLTLRSAAWRLPAPGTDHPRVPVTPGTATLAITTFNRPSYLLALLRQLASSPAAMHVLDEVLVVDQGTALVRDQPGFGEVENALAGRLRVLEQANVGGSGGFSRGMAEVLERGRSRYALLLDDDVSCEPESIVRAVTFADLCRVPTVVGGHMFSLYARSTLHSMGEVVKRWRFWWDAAPHVQPDHDLSRTGLRETPWMHRRIDVDYNGWWMCLIPVVVMGDIGLALPLFIKWDDAEYGLRAGKAGYPTVSMPGVGLWHVPWSEKDDALDWQAYFHQRNRLVAALLHSPYAHGGRLVRESLYHQVKHLLAMQYSVADLRLMAIADVLRGPGHMHADIATILPKIRAARLLYPDAQGTGDSGAFPAVHRDRPLRKDRAPATPGGAVGMLRAAGVAALRQARPVRPSALLQPQAAVPSLDAQWWRLATVDSALVSTTDGTGVAWYRRDRSTFVDLARRSVALHEQLLRTWPQLVQDYADAQPDLVSAKSWRQTFSALPEDDE